jgi:hypothetical protein
MSGVYSDICGGSESIGDSQQSDCKFCKNTGLLVGFKLGRTWYTYQEAMMDGLPSGAGICLTPCPCPAGRRQGDLTWKDFSGTPPQAYKLAAATSDNISTMRQILMETKEKPKRKNNEADDSIMKIISEAREKVGI